MFVFVVVNVLLAFNAGLVHNAALIRECSSTVEAEASSMQKSSYQAVEQCGSCGSSVVEQSASCVQESRSMQQSSSNCYSSSDISSLRSILEQCSFIEQKDWYYSQLESCSPENLIYIKELIEHLNYGKLCFNDFDYPQFQQYFKEITEIYRFLESDRIFDLNCDYTTKRELIEQAQNRLRNIYQNIPESCFLHKPLSFVCQGNYEYLPLICGLTYNLFNSQQTYYTQSTSCSETRSVSSSSTSVSSCQIQPLIPILEQCEYITDKEYYLNYLNRCQSEDLEYISDLINYLNRKEQCLEGIEYTIFEEKMRSIYDILLKNQLYDVNCDLTTKQEILLQARQQLRQLLSTIPQNSFLYRPLNYICQDNNNQLFPLICGLTNSLCESQRTFYSTTTRSSSTNVSSHGSRSVSTSQTESTTTTVSQTEIQPYIEMINQCQYFNTNRDYYLKFLQQCQSEDLEYIVPVLQLLNKREKCLGDFDLIEYQPKIKAIYDILETNQCFDLNYDFAAKQQIFQEAQQQLRLLLNNLPRDSVLYNPLKCLCEGDNYRLFPFLFGTTYGLFESQYSYYSSTSSSSSSCTSSSTSSCGSGSSCTESVQIESQSVQQESSCASRSVSAC